MSACKALVAKTIGLANDVRELLKIFGVRLPPTLSHGRFDGVVRPLVMMDEILARALLPLLSG